MQRKRKRKSKEQIALKESNSNKKKLPLWFKAITIVGLLCVLLLIVGYGAIRFYLKGDGFRENTANSIGKVLGGEAEISSHSWSGWDLKTTDFNFTKGKGNLRKVEAEGLDIGLDISSISSEAWDIPHVDIEQLRLYFSEADQDYQAYQAKKPSGLAALFPYKTKLNSFEVEQVTTELSLKGKQYVFSEMLAQGEVSDNEVYKLELSKGYVSLPIDKFEKIEHLDSTLLFENGDLILSNARVKILDGRSANVDAKYLAETNLFSADISTGGIDIQPFLPSDWRTRLSGLADLEFEFSSGGEHGGEKYEGSVVLNNGRVRKVPILDQLASFTNNTSYRNLELSTCKCDVLILDGDVRLTNIEIEDKGELAIFGDLTVMKDQRVEGALSLGVPKGLLSFLPGAETKVFHPGERGLLWTEVEISGTVDFFKENLSKRLRDAASASMLEMIPGTAEGFLDVLSGKSDGSDLPGPLADKAKIVSEGREVVGETAKAAVGMGVDAISGLLGVGSSSRDLQWWAQLEGMEVSLSSKWKQSEEIYSNTSSPFAELFENQKILAQFFAKKNKGKAREMIEAARKNASSEASQLKSFFTDKEYVAFLFDDPNPDVQDSAVKSVLYAAVQITEGEVLLFKIKSMQADTKFTKINLQDVVESVRIPQQKKKGLIEEIIPDVNPIDLIPNPFK